MTLVLTASLACTSAEDDPARGSPRDGLTPVGGGGGVEAFEAPPENDFGRLVPDPDPTDCYPDRDCEGLPDCPEPPAFCSGDPADPESRFDPTFQDARDGVGEFDVHPDYITAAGDGVDFWPSSRTLDFRVRLAQAPVAGETLLERDGRAYLEFSLGERRIRVLNENSPTFGPDEQPADATLYVRRIALDELKFAATIAPDPTGRDELVLTGAGVFLARDSGSPQSEPVADQELGLTLPGFDSCKSQAIRRFAQGSYNGRIPADMPPVEFPPLRDNSLSNCSRDECIDIHLAWMQAHHNVWRARQMTQMLKNIPNNGQRGYAWGRPGRDWQGETVTERASPRHWFGSFSDDAFQQTRTVINKLWDRFTRNKVGSFNLDMRCPTSGGNVCNTSGSVAAHHIVVGQIDYCDPFFEANGGCYGGSWNEELGTCYGFEVSGDWQRAMLVAHELLHHTTVNGIFVKDKHSHGHGDRCLKGVKILQSMYGYNNIRHLAGIGNCGHHYKGRHNNDSYAYFITEVGELVYRGRMKTWPAWGDPTPMPPENCDVGTEGCYCLPVDPRFDAPDGDYRQDQWCPDEGGEMTCQTTKFNASDIVGICTRCDDFRGGGCECDVDRRCDKGSCWGDLTSNGRLTTGRCYEAPPPAWACLADCRALYNTSTARCYHDHPSGRARCIDGLACEEVEEYGCYQQGQVCYDGACITECATTQDCRYDGMANELDLDYPSYYECTPRLFCEPTL